MASMTAKYKSNAKFPINATDAEKAFKGMRTVFEYDPKQEITIKANLIELAKKKVATLGLPLKNATCELTGLPAEDKRSGEHELKIVIDGKEVAKNKVWINKSVQMVDIGITAAASSETAAKLLAQHKASIPGLTLKLGDGEHAKDIKWQVKGGKSGSLPMTAHTKGAGGKNEKAALDTLKKALKVLSVI